MAWRYPDDLEVWISIFVAESIAVPNRATAGITEDIERLAIIHCSVELPYAYSRFNPCRTKAARLVRSSRRDPGSIRRTDILLPHSCAGQRLSLSIPNESRPASLVMAVTDF